MTKYTIPALLDNAITKYHNQPALAFAGDTPINYEQLGQQVNEASVMLHKLGVTQSDKVAIVSTNMPNWGVAFFGILKLGAVAVPILPDFHNNEIKSIIDHSEAKILFVSENLYNKIEKETFETLQTIILIDRFVVVPQGTSQTQLRKLDGNASYTSDTINYPEVGEEDLASIIYTSGTTGSSKGVMLSHKNLAWNAMQSATLQPIVCEDRFLSLLPLSHTYENTLGLLLPIFHGASVHYLQKPPTASVLLPALKLIKPTKVLSVPLIIEKIFRAKIYPNFQKNAVIRTLYKTKPFRKLLHRVAGKKLMATFGGKVDFFGIGGAKLDPSVEQFLLDARFPYAIGYGLTETSPLLAGTTTKNTRLGSTGTVLQGVNLRISDADPATGEGEIQAKGPNVMKGYYKMPEITAQAFTADGWFRTGDLGAFDSKGFLSIKGRIKNMIVGASGENIYPEEIESVINRMRFVLESVVVQQKGKLVAFIHLNMEEIENQYLSLRSDALQFKEKINERKDEILKEIQNKVNAEVNKFSRIQQVIFQPVPFEKTPTQKIKRFLYYQNI
ncbi:MAG TPA: AMP-binding protein [Prolixibacteraceae bacterium]|nr:AMP-binding protein [Prolixibacteraceae bacterium]